MKKTTSKLLLLALTLTLAACGGTSISDKPTDVSSVYRGTFSNSSNSDSGKIVLDILEKSNGELSGNVQFIYSSCLKNGTLKGTKTGYNLTMTSVQSSTTTVTTEAVEAVEATATSDAVEATDEVTTTTDASVLNFNLTSNGDQLDGTYVITSTGTPNCSNSTGSGSISTSR